MRLWTRDGSGNISSGATATTTLDTTLPIATLSLPAFTNTLSAPVTVGGSDSGSGINGYYLSESFTPPSPSGLDATGWLPSPPSTFTLSAGQGPKTVYVFTRDVAGNVSLAASATTHLDTERPTVNSFSVTAATRTRRLAVSMSAGDTGTGIAGYMVTETSLPPSAGGPGWSTAAPTSFVLSAGDGRKTLYAWAKDRADNVSASGLVPASGSTLLDTTRPVAKLTGPKATRVRNIAIKLTGSDANGVTGYFLSTKLATPSPNARGWRALPPKTYLFPAGDGVKRLYAWTKDAAGNVSARATLITTLDTKPPRVGVRLPAASATLAALKTIRGTAGDPPPGSGLATAAHFAIRQDAAAGADNAARTCAWWNPRTRKLVSGPCGARKWFPMPAKTRWSRAIGNLNESGGYTLFARFRDRAGNQRVVTVRFVIK